MTLAGILLGAGASRRFGKKDKLLEPLRGKPLVTHAASALRDFAPDHLIGVARSASVIDQLRDFDIVSPNEDDPAQSDSLRAGVARAQDLGASRVLIVLGDMPFITLDLLREVVARSTDTRPSAATDKACALPPACFPAASFPDLMALRGDRGAAALLQDLPETHLVPVSSRLLKDIDTHVDLTVANGENQDLVASGFPDESGR
ncbi:MAG: nucleotidyltransferase family protein [Pseudomonadota bacterium]